MFDVVVLAGGSGSRLWPLSRAQKPKQFLALSGDETMLQQTVLRLRDLPIRSITIVCHENHRFFVAEQMRAIGERAQIILEPLGRNTSAAITTACLLLTEERQNADVLVLPADQIIDSETIFAEAVGKAASLVDAGKIVTFCIEPDAPRTGYGYIKKGEKIAEGFAVKEFVEKPDRKTAESYITSGDYGWNSGMFFFKAKHLLAEISKYRPDIYDGCVTAFETLREDLDFKRLDLEAYAKVPSESIDYAVMEKTKDAAAIDLKVRWSDLGSWSSLWDSMEKDCSQNSLGGDTIVVDSTNNLIRAETGLVAAVGVENLIIVSTKDALLVADRENSENVKEIVEILRERGRPEWEIDREVHRPWGKYDSVDRGKRYQVKRITVYPGQRLSLQLHHHRAEHWIVVSGTAEVTRGDEVMTMTENQSVYLPLGVKHSLANPGKLNLEIIEVQSGSYLEEDDIVRFSDIYGRISSPNGE